jgi:hypothetical protein
VIQKHIGPEEWKKRKKNGFITWFGLVQNPKYLYFPGYLSGKLSRKKIRPKSQSEICCLLRVRGGGSILHRLEQPVRNYLLFLNGQFEPAGRFALELMAFFMVDVMAIRSKHSGGHICS